MGGSPSPLPVHFSHVFIPLPGKADHGVLRRHDSGCRMGPCPSPGYPIRILHHRGPRKRIPDRARSSWLPAFPKVFLFGGLLECRSHPLLSMSRENRGRSSPTLRTSRRHSPWRSAEPPVQEIRQQQEERRAALSRSYPYSLQNRPETNKKHTRSKAGIIMCFIDGLPAHEEHGRTYYCSAGLHTSCRTGMFSGPGRRQRRPATGPCIRAALHLPGCMD